MGANYIFHGIDLILELLCLYFANYIVITIVRSSYRLWNIKYSYYGKTTFTRCLKKRAFKPTTLFYSLLASLSEVVLIWPLIAFRH